jgi:dihydrofolate synthase/folylpolyglutamate synthase
VAALARTLVPLARHLVVTQPVSARAATPGEIQECVGRLARRAHRQAEPRRALALARRLAGPNGLVVVAGSLYLVGAALRFGERRRRRRP